MFNLTNESGGEIGDGFVARLSRNLLSFPVGVETRDEVNDYFSLFPNPNNGDFQIRIKQHKGDRINIAINALDGRNVANFVYSNSEAVIPISLGDLNSGMYLISVSSPRGYYTLKFTKL